MPNRMLFATDAKITHRRDARAAAEAVAHDHRNDRMTAQPDRLHSRIERSGVDLLALGRAALRFHRRDVGSRRERLRARAAQHDAAQLFVGRQRIHRVAEPLPHREVEGVEHLRPVERHRRDVALMMDGEFGMVHRARFPLGTIVSRCRQIVHRRAAGDETPVMPEQTRGQRTGTGRQCSAIARNVGGLGAPEAI